MTDDLLARQLVTQAQEIARLRHDLEELAKESAQISADLLARIEESAPSTVSAPSSWCWRDAGPQATEELWTQLRGWVSWLRGRYPLAKKVPPCWPEHPEIVEELTALWLAWEQAYRQRDAPLTAAADWHDRWLPGVLHRLEHGAFSVDCTDGHQSRPDTSYASPRMDGTHALDPIGPTSPSGHTARSSTLTRRQGAEHLRLKPDGHTGG